MTDAFEQVKKGFIKLALSKDPDDQMKAKTIAKDFKKMNGMNITLRDKEGNIVWGEK